MKNKYLDEIELRIENWMWVITLVARVENRVEEITN